jgi:hypothetical protein
MSRSSSACFAARALFAAGALSLLCACERPFNPYNRLTGFRVLALIADPPTPAPGETSTLSALAYLPGAGVGTALPGLVYAWSLCLDPGSADAGFPCAAPLDLGSDATATFVHAIDPTILAQACAGAGAMPAPFDCEGGFPAQIKLTVTSTRGVADTIVAVSDIRLRFDAATSANLRPTVDALAVVKDGVDVALATPDSGGDPVITLARNAESAIKAVVPAAASESYLGRNDDLQPALVHERLTFTWFVETGTTEQEHTGYLEGAGTLARNLTNKWTPGLSKDFPGNRAHLIVVARDNRGGVGWRAGLVGLEPLP